MNYTKKTSIRYSHKDNVINGSLQSLELPSHDESVIRLCHLTAYGSTYPQVHKDIDVKITVFQGKGWIRCEGLITEYNPGSIFQIPQKQVYCITATNDTGFLLDTSNICNPTNTDFAEETYPLFQICVDDKKLLLNLYGAGNIINSGWIKTSFGQFVINHVGAVPRLMNETDRQLIYDKADEISDSK